MAAARGGSVPFRAGASQRGGRAASVVSSLDGSLVCGLFLWVPDLTIPKLDNQTQTQALTQIHNYIHYLQLTIIMGGGGAEDGIDKAFDRRPKSAPTAVFHTS